MDKPKFELNAANINIIHKICEYFKLYKNFISTYKM